MYSPKHINRVIERARCARKDSQFVYFFDVATAETRAEFFNRGKREFAESSDVNVSLVIVEFRVVA